jgi:type II secretory pathway pseudopilin PulG
MMPSRTARTRAPREGSEAGFSLIEVVLALGLLAGVLISITSLFLLGGKQVKNGKSTTTAAAITHEILERIEQLPYDQVYTYFGGTSTGTSLSVLTTGGGNAGQWQAEIQEKLGPQASGTIQVLPLGTASPLNFGNAHALQVRVTLNWNELGRNRNCALQAIRF